MGKHKKEKLGEQSLYLVTGISDIYYEMNEENKTAKLGFGNTYLLGIYKKHKDAISAINIHNNDSDFGNEPLEPWFKDDLINYIAIEEIIYNDTPFIGTQSVETRDLYTFIDSDDPGYVHINSTNVSSKLSKIFDIIYSRDEGYDFLNTAVINMSNTVFIIDNAMVDITELSKCEFDDIEESPVCTIKENEPNEVEFKEDITDDELRKELKEFISNPKNDLTINNKNIKTSEDVDDLSDDDIGFIKETLINQIEADCIDDFFVR